MIVLILSWIALWAAFSGAGLLLLRILRKRIGAFEDLFAAFWIGWVCLLFFLILWHFFLPVTPWILPGAAIIGVAGWWLSRHELGFLRGVVSWRGAGLALLGLALAILLAGKAVQPIDSGDTGEYHLPETAWSGMYPLVPGLGNLQPRYAYNQSVFLMDALLGAGPFAGNPQQVPNGLLLWAGLGQSLLAFSRLFSPAGRRSKANLFLAMMLGPLMDQINQKGFVSLSPDPVIFVLGIVIFAELLRLIFDKPEANSDLASVSLPLLLAAGITVKTSFAGFALAAGCVAAFFIVRGFTAWPAAARRATLAAVLISAAGTIAWLVRGIILSGYPAFPSALAGLPLDFKIPESELAAEMDWVILRARNFDVPLEEIVRGPGWFAQWYANLPVTILKPLELIIASGIATLVALRRDRLPALRPLAVVLLVPLAAIAFWFLLAPAPRFLGSALWILVALLIFLVLECLPLGEPAREALPALSAWLFLIWTLTFVSIPRQIPSSGFLLPPDRSVHPAYTTRLLADGTGINIPDEDECWSVPQPCTNHFLEGLELRTPGNLRDGFRIR